MKTARFVLKIIAGSLALVAAVCAVIGFWDKLMNTVHFITKIIRNAKSDPTNPFRPAEYQDYADMGDYADPLD